MSMMVVSKVVRLLPSKCPQTSGWMMGLEALVSDICSGVKVDVNMVGVVYVAEE
jgi:hypothetical protein